MNDYIKARFAQVYFRSEPDKRGRPDLLPERIVALYDEATDLHSGLCNRSEPDPKTRWIIVKMAELIERIEALEGKRSAPIASKTMPDMRTREGRALKAALAGAT